MPSAKRIQEISLFLPAYNEAENIAKTIADADRVLKKHARKYEILVIDDGSKDKTGSIVKALAKKNKNIRLITHKPNRGYGGAFKSGLYGSRYQLVSFIDSDGQFDYSELVKFIPLIKDNDLVIGYRIKRQDNFLRTTNATLWKLWVWLLFGLWVKDIDCAFKVIKKPVIDSIDLTTESALTSAEFLIRTRQAGFKLAQVGVHHYPRTAGEQTGANPKVIIKAFKQSLQLWYLMNLAD